MLKLIWLIPILLYLPFLQMRMAAANRLAGYSLGQSDLLRRAMGSKRSTERMRRLRGRFVRRNPTRRLLWLGEGKSHDNHEAALLARLHAYARPLLP
jgi:hypothetical protein